MTGASPEERAARLRACRAYGGLGREAMREVLGVGDRTLSRYLSGEKPAAIEEIERVALRAGVPDWFARYGFSPPPDPDTVAYRVEAIEHRLRRLEES